MAALSYSYAQLGLPELPFTTKEGSVELDLRSLYFAVQNLAYSVGQAAGIEPPADGMQGNIQYTMGAWKRRLYLPATEAIAYGQLVNTFDNAGTYSVRLADATDDTKPCHGICNTVGGAGIGATVEIVLPNAYVNSIGGLAHGTIYYLDTTPGGGSNTPPSTSGNIVQAVGLGLGPTDFFFNPAYQWELVP